MRQEKAVRITITLPPDMLALIKKEEEHKARISLIRERLAHSAQSGEPVPLDTAFKSIENLHKQRMKASGR
jgi:antitoxin ParD1/3/4